MGDKKAAIIASGPISSYDFLLRSIPENTYIICADGGLFHCEKANLIPDVIIGDMDSYDGTVDEKKLIKYPVEKDDTDTALCIKYAIEKGYNDIEVFGAIGGRFDHSFANVQLLLYCKEKGVSCRLRDKETVLVVHNESVKMEIEKGTTVSVFSLSVKAKNVTLKGLKYSLENAILYNNFPLGISNVATDDNIEITVGDGTLLVIISH